MIDRFALRIGIAPIVLAMAVAGCTTPRQSMFLPSASSHKSADLDRQSARSFALAQQALAKGDSAAALGHSEKAVELSPKDAGYRMLLGDLYLKNGRFASAETSFADVLALDPGNHRAGFNLVLAEIALGKRGSALDRLEGLSATASAADLGLAFALAGEPDRAVTLLEGAARSPQADGRVRQNLALAYAMAGDWQRAQVTAGQDLSPADLAGRIAQWAAFVQPAAQWDQVASLLGVTPAEDPGQPVRLALAPPAGAVMASAEPAAGEQSWPLPAFERQSDARPEATAAIETPVLKSEPERPRPLAAPKVQSARGSLAKAAARPAPKVGGFVVQLASYDSAGALADGWSLLRRRFGLGSAAPLSAVVTLPGKGRFHRLSLGGYATRSGAAGACAAIRSKGGSCFVRAQSGDVAMRWASR